MEGAESLKQRLLADGLIASAEATLTPLTGGVSSDIYRVEDGERIVVVKQALATLRVADEWKADLSRNDFERAYIEYVGRIEPGAVPKLLGGGQGYFAMEFLGDGFANWKQLLLDGDARPGHAALAAGTLGRIHRASAGDQAAQTKFDSTNNFRQLRTDPYLRTTGDRHPEWRNLFHEEAARLERTRACLVHGDFSPKNLLIAGERLVILDSEVAWYGDPVFDVAFLLNHLLLKGLHHAPQDAGLRTLYDTAVSAYFQALGLQGAARADQERATGWLLLMLLLARVDGKSPVEYLDDAKRDHIRRFVACYFDHGTRPGLAELADAWFAALPEEAA